MIHEYQLLSLFTFFNILLTNNPEKVRAQLVDLFPIERQYASTYLSTTNSSTTSNLAMASWALDPSIVREQLNFLLSLSKTAYVGGGY